MGVSIGRGPALDDKFASSQPPDMDLEDVQILAFLISRGDFDGLYSATWRRREYMDPAVHD